MLVTLDTAHFERSLLNTDALENAVQIIQEQEYNKRKKRDKEQIPKRKKKIGNNILVGYSLLDTKMEIYKEQYTNNKRERKEVKLNGYVLLYMLITLDTSHFEISLLNLDAPENAVQIIQ